MITVEQYEYVRVGRRVYGKSIKKLARETGHSKNTIRKILRDEYGGYKSRDTQPYPVLDPYKDVIDEWLKADKDKPRKQRHTARRIYNRLVEEKGYQGSEPTVRRYVRQAKALLGLKTSGSYIPLVPDVGQEAEVDWGQANVIIGGQVETCKFFCMRSKYSGKTFVRFYRAERQQCLFDAHMQGFLFFGGVFPTLVYDNMTTAVQKVLRGKNRILQDEFRKFCSYYSFKAGFCTPAKGNEKGGVEGVVGYARRNFMVPLPEAESLEALNEDLLKKCLGHGEHVTAGRTRKINQLFEQEEDRLLPLPDHPFSNTLHTRGKVDHYSTVIVDKNRYSVPASFAGVKVSVNLGVSRVEIFYEGKKIASHSRQYGNNKWALDPDHYLDLLEKRPGAFDTARPIKQWRVAWPDAYDQLLARLRTAQGVNKGTKDFISVLKLCRSFKTEEVTRAIEVALKAGVSSGEAVHHLIVHPVADQKSDPVPNWSILPKADVSVYGQLGGVI